MRWGPHGPSVRIRMPGVAPSSHLNHDHKRLSVCVLGPPNSMFLAMPTTFNTSIAFHHCCLVMVWLMGVLVWLMGILAQGAQRARQAEELPPHAPGAARPRRQRPRLSLLRLRSR